MVGELEDGTAEGELEDGTAEGELEDGAELLGI